MAAKYEKFGTEVWRHITASPLGSTTKRETELALLRAAIDAGIVGSSPAEIAKVFRITLARAQGYLTELALRQQPLKDTEAVARLVAELKKCEIVNYGTYFLLPLHDAALRIWLERKVATLNLNADATVHREMVKLTPIGLARILGASEGIAKPYDALRSLPEELHNDPWVIEAKQKWNKSINWPDAINALGNTVTIAQTVIPVLLRTLGA